MHELNEELLAEVDRRREIQWKLDHLGSSIIGRYQHENGPIGRKPPPFLTPGQWVSVISGVLLLVFVAVWAVAG